MVAQLIAGVRMREHVELAMIERQPADDFGKVGLRERDLEAPTWMWPDGPFVKSSHRNAIAEPGRHDIPKCPRRMARRGIEVDVRMPAFDMRDVEIGAYFG